MGTYLADLFSLDQKATFLELGLTSGIPIVIGIILFSIALRAQDNGASSKLRWFALIPFAVGAVLSWKFLNGVMNDPAYMAANWPGYPREGRKDVVFHYASFILPIAIGIVCVIWGIVHSRTQAEQY